ncbi:uncharacterized protein LOC131640502 [Vicia villosa]|uniref:uncharacterized protein LOC131640502 n=1 Tax=Vicia villosa TaxID=3911 RepID=UPI00273A9462|nr:uncharacterized protein LOC131640502 [Vicia villosa]
MLRKSDGTTITKQDDIEQEITEFYGNLMGAESPKLAQIDIESMRKSKQLSWDQREFLQRKVTMQEIDKALKGIGDKKSQGIDGYGARLYKSSWHIIKDDVSPTASSIKDYRPIAACTTFYKIISRILTDRLGQVMQFLINKCQAAFSYGQHIHNHILIAYELIKGYGRKHGTPRCMMQLDLQKSYDMVNWKPLRNIMGDSNSVAMLLSTVNAFSMSTGLTMNPQKCKLFCGGVDITTKDAIKMITGFEEGYNAAEREYYKDPGVMEQYDSKAEIQYETGL